MKRLFLFFTTLLISPLTAFAHRNDSWNMVGWGHMMNFGYGGMFIWMILFLIIIGLLIYFIMQIAKSKSSEGLFRETPLDILKKRYARGEITKEEFEKIKKDL